MLRLYYADYCPFCLRIEWLLDRLGLDHERVSVDLANMPDTLVSLSPQKTVPTLEIDHGVGIFESLTILEYLNDRARAGLTPNAADELALMRCWLSYANGCFANQYYLLTAENEATFDDVDHRTQMQLHHLDRFLASDSGQHYRDHDSLLDFAYAPVLLRYRRINQLFSLFDEDDFPHIARWTKRLLLTAPFASAAPHSLRGGEFTAMVTGAYLLERWPPDQR